MKKILPALLVVMLLNFSCCKQVDELTGTIRDYTGLDGCSLVIVLDNGSTLEPVELPANTALIADKKVSVRYRSLNDRFTNCMAGLIVKITSLRYL